MKKNAITVFEPSNQRMNVDHAALALTVETLFKRYSTEGRHLPDGSLKTEVYLEHLRLTGRYLAKFFGRTQLVSELTPDRIHDYVVWRRSGGVGGRRVRPNTIQRDLGYAATHWRLDTPALGDPQLPQFSRCFVASQAYLKTSQVSI